MCQDSEFGAMIATSTVVIHFLNLNTDTIHHVLFSETRP